MKILSFDAESNGLYGHAFVIGAVVTEDDKEIDRYVSRCPILGKVDPWVRSNVFPRISNVPIDRENYNDLIDNFYEFYHSNKKNAEIISYIPYPVETKLLRDMIRQNFSKRRGDSPFPLIDVASVLRAKGERANSLDDYISKNNLIVPFDGGYHNPLYDAIATEVAYRHLLK